MFKSTVKIIFNNYYLIFGIIIGLFLNFSFIELDCTQKSTFIPDFNYSNLRAVIKSNVSHTPTSKNVPVRPRYYSTELGIREKLFVGVFTSEEKLQTQTAHVNKTLHHLVPQIKFFMSAAPSRRKNKLDYSGLIGFTEGKPSHRPFQVVKYICDNYLQDYDFYFLMNDYNYLDVRKLQGIVEKISVSSEVYAGSVVKDGSYCNMDAGILLSNSVMKAMKEHIEWCVMNAVTSDNSENLGRCVYYATKLECQENLYGAHVASYKLRSFDLEKKFKALQRADEFNNAVTVYPIINKEDFYLLHSHYAKLHLQRLKKEIAELSVGLTEHWPPGERPGSVPATRFDLPNKFYFNKTHIYAPDDFTIVRRHKRVEQLDIDYILQEILKKTNENRVEKLEILDVINGYRTFDLARGVDYVFDVNFLEKSTKKVINKRFEVSKPLGTSEFVHAPYVTENTKISLVLPVEETEVESTLDFLRKFDQNIMEKKEKVLLMLVFLYQADSPSKGDEDVFVRVKSAATKCSNKYRSEDTKVAWLSVRLPPAPKLGFVARREYGVLNFACVDLALKKVGVESLILFVTPRAEMQADFLNRVRMNTVLGFQVFSAIPFRFYDPALSDYDADRPEVSKNSGHFDAEVFDYVAFYGRDYVAARKRSKHLVPLTRVDNDIANVLEEAYRARGNVFEMFVEFAEDVHCLRAPDASLRMKYREEMGEGKRNWFLATKTQLGKIVLSHSAL